MLWKYPVMFKTKSVSMRRRVTFRTSTRRGSSRRVSRRPRQARPAV